MGDDDRTATILAGEIRLKRDTRGKKDPLHSWVPGSESRTGRTATAANLGCEKQ